MILPELVKRRWNSHGLASAFTVRRRNRWCKGNQLRGEKRKMMSVGSGEHRSLVAQKGNNQTPKTRNGMILILSSRIALEKLDFP
jgi:hypothetical protein